MTDCVQRACCFLAENTQGSFNSAALPSYYQYVHDVQEKTPVLFVSRLAARIPRHEGNNADKQQSHASDANIYIYIFFFPSLLTGWR